MPNEQVLTQFCGPEVVESSGRIKQQHEQADGTLRVSEIRKPAASVRPGKSIGGASSSPSTVFEPLLDLHEAATVLGIHWKTLEAKARGREVPAFKVGKRWRFRLSSLNQRLEHGIKSNTAERAV